MLSSLQRQSSLQPLQQINIANTTLLLEEKLPLVAGHGIMGGRAFCDLAPADDDLCAQLADYAERRFKGEHVTAAGMFSVVAVDGDTITIACDPMGFTPILKLELAGLSIIGNAIDLMASAYRAITGDQLTRDITSAAYEAALGTVPAGQTGYREISFIPPFTSLKINSATGQVQHSRLLPPTSDNREDALDKAAQALTNNIKAIHTTFPEAEIVQDITGGLDTRVVLAAQLAAGVPVKYFNGPEGPVEDRDIPLLLGNHFGLERVNFPENFDGEHMTLWQLSRRAVFRQQGTATIYEQDLGRCATPNIVRLRGMAGEMIRINYALKPYPTLKKLLRGIISRPKGAKLLTALKRNPFKLQETVEDASYFLHKRMAYHGQWFTDGFYHTAYQAVKKAVSDIHELGARSHQLTNGFYIAVRGNRHCCRSNMLLNKVRPTFEPLCDPHIWALASTYSAEELLKGQAYKDLFLRLAPDVMTIPTGHKSYADKSLGFTHYQRDGDPIPVPKSRDISTIQPAQIIDQNYANKHGYHGRGLMPQLEKYRELIQSFDEGHDIWQALNFTRWQKLATATDFAAQVSKSPLLHMRMFHALIWMAGEEEAVGIERMYQG